MDLVRCSVCPHEGDEGEGSGCCPDTASGDQVQMKVGPAEAVAGSAEGAIPLIATEPAPNQNRELIVLDTPTGSALDAATTPSRSTKKKDKSKRKSPAASKEGQKDRRARVEEQAPPSSDSAVMPATGAAAAATATAADPAPSQQSEDGGSFGPPIHPMWHAPNFLMPDNEADFLEMDRQMCVFPGLEGIVPRYTGPASIVGAV